MIYELRTYDLKMGTGAKFEAAFTDGLSIRTKYSPLAAFWRTEIGPLGQVVHVWPYQDIDQRETIRATARKDPSGKWPPKTEEFTGEQLSEIFQPAPFMHPLEGKVQELGKVYEMRMYTYAAGGMPKVLEAWGKVIEEREKFSPLAACWYSDIGRLNRFIHVWPYKDMAERERVRVEANKALAGKWPPATGDLLLKMENKLLTPAPFSPLR